MRRAVGIVVERLVNGKKVCVTNPTDCCPGGGSGSSSSSGGGSDGPIPIPCCPDPVPATLHATVSDNGGQCSCAGGSFPIVWDGSKWTGAGQICGHGVTLEFRCRGTFLDFVLTVIGDGCGFTGTDIAPSLVAPTCSPLFFIFRIKGWVACGCEADFANDIAFAITE